MEAAREAAGLFVLILGAAIAIVGFIAAGWWSLIILGGSGLAMAGLVATTHRIPEDDGEDLERRG